MLYAGVEAYEFNRLWFLNHWPIGRCFGQERRNVFVCLGFPRTSPIWLLPGREVTSGIGNFPRTHSKVSAGSPNVIGADEAASSSVWGWTTVGTFNSVILYFWSLLLKCSAASPRPGRVNLSSFIRFWRKHSLRCFTGLEVVPITPPGSSF